MSGNKAKYQYISFFTCIRYVLGQNYSEDRVFARVLRLVFASITLQFCIRHDCCIYTTRYVVCRHRICFVVRSDVLLNPEYGRSAVGAERTDLINPYYVFTTVSSQLLNSPHGTCIVFPVGTSAPSKAFKADVEHKRRKRKVGRAR